MARRKKAARGGRANRAKAAKRQRLEEALCSMHDEEEDSSDDDGDWQEVPEVDMEVEDQPSTSGAGDVVDIRVVSDDKAKQEQASLRRTLSAARRAYNRLLHTAHTLCLVAHARHISAVANDAELGARALSLLSEAVIDASRMCEPFDFFTRLLRFHRAAFRLSDAKGSTDLRERLTSVCNQRMYYSEHIEDLDILLICVLRALGYQTRVVLGMTPTPLKPQLEEECSSAGDHAVWKEQGLSKKERQVEWKKKQRMKQVEKRKAQKTLGALNSLWVEVYSERWICLRTRDALVDYPTAIFEHHKCMTYAVASGDDLSVFDVTLRYMEVNDYLAKRLDRLPSDLWSTLQRSFRRRSHRLAREEDIELHSRLMSGTMPATLAQYKGHPLYVLQKHLKKYEAIYPRDARPVEHFNEEPVFSRNQVHTLRSADNWLKDAREVMKDELEHPYKIVKGNLTVKQRRQLQRENPGDAAVALDSPQLELYGYWQTQPYQPPTAVDGVVPRNRFGNVYLFKACMRPYGTVHLRLPGLASIAKRLGIDCADAHVGWDVTVNGSMPLKDGYIVCTEHEQTLTLAWQEKAAQQRRQQNVRRSTRAMRNWARLARGIVNRMRVRERFADVGEAAAD